MAVDTSEHKEYYYMLLVLHAAGCRAAALFLVTIFSNISSAPVVDDARSCRLHRIGRAYKYSASNNSR